MCKNSFLMCLEKIITLIYLRSCYFLNPSINNGGVYARTTVMSGMPTWAETSSVIMQGTDCLILCHWKHATARPWFLEPAPYHVTSTLWCFWTPFVTPGLDVYSFWPGSSIRYLNQWVMSFCLPSNFPSLQFAAIQTTSDNSAMNEVWTRYSPATSH